VERGEKFDYILFTVSILSMWYPCQPRSWNSYEMGSLWQNSWILANSYLEGELICPLVVGAFTSGCIQPQAEKIIYSLKPGSKKYRILAL
jgi:hypothetical protein